MLWSKCFLKGAFVFSVDTTTVEDRQPILNQETEQLSVPGHTGNFIYYTLTCLALTSKHGFFCPVSFMCLAFFVGNSFLHYMVFLAVVINVT